MGAGISLLASASSGTEEIDDSKLGLGDIHESCLASVLIHLTPTEICRLALLSRSFRGAASADFVWESKLPKNYRYLVDKLFDEIPSYLSKKEIYARLCLPNSLDGGTKEVWLDRSTGGICFSISARALAITGIDDRRYWNYIPTEESRWLKICLVCFAAVDFRRKRGPSKILQRLSREKLCHHPFHLVAYLQQIWWLEIDGAVEFQLPVGTYSLFFRIHLGRASRRLGRRVCNSEHVHGWDLKPVRFQLSTSDGQHAQSQCYLGGTGNWLHYHVGDFQVENSDALTKVKFSMTQIDCTHTKGGLCVDSVLIYPSGFRDKEKAS